MHPSRVFPLVLMILLSPVTVLAGEKLLFAETVDRDYRFVYELEIVSKKEIRFATGLGYESSKLKLDRDGVYRRKARNEKQVLEVELSADHSALKWRMFPKGEVGKTISGERIFLAQAPCVEYEDGDLCTGKYVATPQLGERIPRVHRLGNFYLDGEGKLLGYQDYASSTMDPMERLHQAEEINLENPPVKCVKDICIGDTVELRNELAFTLFTDKQKIVGFSSYGFISEAHGSMLNIHDSARSVQKAERFSHKDPRSCGDISQNEQDRIYFAAAEKACEEYRSKGNADYCTRRSLVDYFGFPYRSGPGENGSCVFGGWIFGWVKVSL